MIVSNCETIFLELDHISGWLAFPPVKFKQQTITKRTRCSPSFSSRTVEQGKFADKHETRHREEGDSQIKERTFLLGGTLKKWLTFQDATTGFAEKRRLRDDHRKSILMTHH